MIVIILILFLLGLITFALISVCLIISIGWVFIIPLAIDIAAICLLIKAISKKKGGKN
jgi:hypothetical protein